MEGCFTEFIRACAIESSTAYLPRHNVAKVSSRVHITHEFWCHVNDSLVLHVPAAELESFSLDAGLLDQHIVDHLSTRLLDFLWGEGFVNQVQTVVSDGLDKSVVLNSVNEQVKKWVVRLSFLKGILKPGSPLFFNDFAVKHCNSTIIDRFLHFLLELLLVEVEKIACHLAAAKQCKPSKSISHNISWPILNYRRLNMQFRSCVGLDRPQTLLNLRLLKLLAHLQCTIVSLVVVLTHQLGSALACNLHFLNSLIVLVFWHVYRTKINMESFRAGLVAARAKLLLWGCSNGFRCTHDASWCGNIRQLHNAGNWRLLAWWELKPLLFWGVT